MRQALESRKATLAGTQSVLNEAKTNLETIQRQYEEAFFGYPVSICDNGGAGRKGTGCGAGSERLRLFTGCRRSDPEA